MTSRRLRVLVADDSTTARRRLVEALRADPALEVVGEATDGAEVLARCEMLRPDVIMLDLAMPGMDGVRATEEIMARTPTPILIVSASEPDEEPVKSAIDAGAVDALEKPSAVESDESFDARLVRAVRLVARIPVVTRPRVRPRLAPPPNPPVAREIRRELVAIGGSTGGPAALAELLRRLPAGYPLPILVVLHIGPAFGFGFPEWLSTLSPLPVVEAAHGAAPEAGRVHVCPPDRHLVLRGGRMWLTQDPERHSCRPSVDVLFESLADEAGASVIACLLTGIGRDGAEGLARLRGRGALTLAQDEASSAVFGMPREAILRGAAVHVGPPSELAMRLVTAARVGRTAGMERGTR